MTRTTAVTIAVVTGSDRRVTRELLDRLAPELGPHDNVVLLGKGSAGLAEPATWRLVSARGDLRRPRDGEHPRTRPTVVVVDDRVDAAPGWVDLLAAALADPTVGAVAPRSNWADGDELFVGVPYRPDEHGARRVFQRETMASKRDLTTEVGLLAGPCIAARREVLDGLGGLGAVLGDGFDPARLARKVSEAGLRLVVAEGCYVHHPGGPTRRPDPSLSGTPLVSACLIVRDEQENLLRCLQSIDGLADEIVVYDTGSTDSTVQIATDAGARVLLGYWDDDFGRARNDALAACRGQWVLWLDADETLVCDDTTALRAHLAASPTSVESYVLLIDNLVGNEAGSTFTHPACRLFRRAYGHWEGHVHEQVQARAGREWLTRELLEDARIAHRGYLQSAISERSKGERNLRTAFSDLVDGPGLDWSTRLLSLGRSYGMAGRIEESLDHCRDAASKTTSPWELRLAQRTVIDALLGLGRTSEALQEIAALRATMTSSALADIFEGQAHLARKEYDEALVILDRVGHSIDEDGFQYSPSMVASAKAEALIALGRHGEAADALLGSIRESNGVDAHLGRLIECLETTGRDLGEIHDALGTARIQTFVPQLLQLEPAAADRTLEAWYGRDATSRPILAGAAQVAWKLGIERQLIWSSRLRSVGLANACPLLRSAMDSRAPARYRALSAAACHTLFGDTRALHSYAAALLATPAAERAQLRTDVAAIAPTLAGLLDELEPPESVFSDTPAPSDRAGASVADGAPGVAVLVLDRRCSSLRTLSLAGLLAAAGHEVTLAQPLPPQASQDLLGNLGVTVRGWHDSPTPDGSWLERSTAALATITAERAHDVVVVAAGAAEMLPALRRLMPAALVAVDLDDGTTLPDLTGDVDLVLAADRSVGGPGAPGVAVPTSTRSLLPPQAHLPLSGRSGLVLVADVRQLDRGAATALCDRLEPVVELALRTSSVTFCGDDPARAVRDRFPGVLICDPMANPAPHLGAARVVLVCHLDGASHWVDAARQCGTPVVVLPPDASTDGEVLDATRSLLLDDVAWASRAAATPTAPTSRADRLPEDPIALVTSLVHARRRRGATGDPRPVVVTIPSLAGAPAAAPLEPSHLRPAPELFTPLLAGNPTQDAARVGDETWPPRSAPLAGAAVVAAVAWPFGGLPAEWIAPLRDVVTEVWVPTDADRTTALRSGVAPGTVRVVQPGVDTALFNPAGARFPLATDKSVRLLFVGPWSEDGGIDVALEGYLATFGAHDDVCLVVAAHGPGSATHGVSLERDCRRAAATGRAAIEIVEEPLADAQMADLYRSCTALVHTSRSTTLARPVLEALASGLPVVASRRAGLTSLLDDTESWLLSSREASITSTAWTASKAGSWWLEPRRTELRAALAEIAAHPAEAARRGARARRVAVDQLDLAAARADLARAIGEISRPASIDVTDRGAREPVTAVGA